MEADGLLVREPGTGTYSLTPAGIRAAIEQGITPPAPNYFGDIPANVDLPTGPIDMDAIRRRQAPDLEFVEWILWVLLMGAEIAVAEFITLKLIHYF